MVAASRRTAQPRHQPADVPGRQDVYRIHALDSEVRTKTAYRRAQAQFVVLRELEPAAAAARRDAQPAAQGVGRTSAAPFRLPLFPSLPAFLTLVRRPPRLLRDFRKPHTLCSRPMRIAQKHVGSMLLDHASGVYDFF
ncbi:hypothetical protein AXK11_03530 [Cephaloticoccus primus]|uniref:Uncharacterized protein n=1 Tax=Cephaloticoccus primus TaxID=1548207 RepID=A0A139SPU5_9BACT|nr:hypothetical protein AXK11_03530 [Cephaloticoccus primus]